MKKRNIIITAAGVLTLSAALFVGFWARQYNKPYPAGTVDKAVVKPISSEIYTEQDYNDAVDCVKDFFPQFETCELLELRYAGDKKTKLESKYSQNENEEYMVLMSDFYVNKLELFQNERSAWNRDYTYTDWNWILCREKGASDWKICNYGYA
ncbi:hypothetical protein [uncultured Ruminococcus sp.]|uniref:hypothetical protein n=1 Tax=uncultured Ruminococcus sp. TaxID=165186 RepID=UPI0025F45A76|nr:hypothetical protein [uncultured Ruminococcus sp.]